MGKLMLIFLSSVIAAFVFASSVRAEDDQKSRQQEQKFEKEIKVRVTLGYLLYLPPEYSKEEKKWPLVVFLHGAGESGSDLARVKIHGPPKLAETRDFPAIIVSPQSPGRGWNVDALSALIDDVVASFKVDRSRIYLTGLSMGGYGTWSLAAAHPEKFAAIVPICGGGNPADAHKIKDIPAWVFHGAKDSVVPARNSETMVQALKDAGAKNVQYTLYPDAGHDSWTETYDNPELWKWLFQQRRAAE